MVLDAALLFVTVILFKVLPEAYTSFAVPRLIQYIVPLLARVRLVIVLLFVYETLFVPEDTPLLNNVTVPVVGGMV